MKKKIFESYDSLRILAVRAVFELIVGEALRSLRSGDSGFAIAQTKEALTSRNMLSALLNALVSRYEKSSS
jgi:hypothetical protein